MAAHVGRSGRPDGRRGGCLAWLNMARRSSLWLNAAFIMGAIPQA
jgi:hypothetical protein